MIFLGLARYVLDGQIVAKFVLCTWVVGARRAGLSISEMADLLGFSCTAVSRVYKECS